MTARRPRRPILKAHTFTLPPSGDSCPLSLMHSPAAPQTWQGARCMARGMGTAPHPGRGRGSNRHLLAGNRRPTAQRRTAARRLDTCTHIEACNVNGLRTGYQRHTSGGGVGREKRIHGYSGVSRLAMTPVLQRPGGARHAPRSEPLPFPLQAVFHTSPYSPTLTLAVAALMTAQRHQACNPIRPSCVPLSIFTLSHTSPHNPTLTLVAAGPTTAPRRQAWACPGRLAFGHRGPAAWR